MEINDQVLKLLFPRFLHIFFSKKSDQQDPRFTDPKQPEYLIARPRNLLRLRGPLGFGPIGQFLMELQHAKNKTGWWQLKYF